MRSIAIVSAAALLASLFILSPAVADSDDNWSSQFAAPGFEGGVSAVAFMGTDMYVGGNFKTVNGVEVPYIAKWDGASWSPLGGGLDDGVNALAVVGGDLYAGGAFQNADGASARNIARYGRSPWAPGVFLPLARSAMPAENSHTQLRNGARRQLVSQLPQ
jgi:hypothetical protein